MDVNPTPDNVPAAAGQQIHTEANIEKVAAPFPVGMTYTCPMHPEVRQEHQGHCPECGTTLEPETPSLGDDGNAEPGRTRGCRTGGPLGGISVLPARLDVAG
jgi:hypothetical protein